MGMMSLRRRLVRSVPVSIITRTAKKCWAYSGAFLLICITLYWFYGGAIAFSLLCLATTGFLYQAQDQLLYGPDMPTHSRVYVPAPTTVCLNYQNIYIRARDGTMLHAFLILHPEELSKEAPTILYLHGNAGNIGHRLNNVADLYRKVACNILLLEYRGYGLSQGTPSEEGLYMDAQAGLDFLTSRTDINPSEIIVFGRSLGGAVAIDLASREENNDKIWCLIVENTFTSVPEMATVILRSRLFAYLPLFFYKNKFMSVRKIHNVKIPTFFISGLSDELVPPRMMTALFKRCKSTYKIFNAMKSGTHNDTWNRRGYYERMEDFLQGVRVGATNSDTCQCCFSNLIRQV